MQPFVIGTALQPLDSMTGIKRWNLSNPDWTSRSTNKFRDLTILHKMRPQYQSRWNSYTFYIRQRAYDAAQSVYKTTQSSLIVSLQRRLFKHYMHEGNKATLSTSISMKANFRGSEMKPETPENPKNELISISSCKTKYQGWSQAQRLKGADHLRRYCGLFGSFWYRAATKSKRISCP